MLVEFVVTVESNHIYRFWMNSLIGLKQIQKWRCHIAFGLFWETYANGNCTQRQISNFFNNYWSV